MSAKRGAPVVPDNDMKLVQRSLPLVYQNKARIGARCFARLFEAAPELQALFQGPYSPSHEMLLQELTLIVRASASDTPLPQLCRLATQHSGLGVQPAHFPLMREALVGAIADTLGEAVCGETLQAWRRAFDHMAAPMAARCES